MKFSPFKALLLIFSIFIINSCKSDDTEVMVEDPKAENRLSLGVSAEDMLSDDIYKSLTIEMIYAGSFRPTQEAIDNFKAFILSRVNKSGGVTFIERMIPDQDGSPFAISEIRDIEDEHRTRYTTEDNIAMFVYFSNGVAQGDSASTVTLGTAYQNTSIVIFENTLRTLTEDKPELLPDLESATLQHEMGHVWGLVNILGDDIHNDHEDPDNNKHCIVEECLMYFESSVSTRIMERLQQRSSVPGFDPLCLEDLQAKGGK